MHNNLILSAFKKGEKDLALQGVKKPSITAISEFIANYINDDCGIPINSRTLRNYYNQSSGNNKDDINISRPDIIKPLCLFLGYSDYHDFINQRESKTGTLSYTNRIKDYHITYLGSFKNLILGTVFIGIVILSYALLMNKNEPRFMIWKTDHYEEVELDLKQFDLNDLKVFKKERVENFKQIQPNCNYTFFNPDGSVRIWYGKNENDYEFFTDLGLHPETGKTLKPITKYIIDKHICN